MFFNSFIFFIFLAAVLAIYLSLGTRRGRAVCLLAASCLFYGYWDWRFLSLLAVSTVVDFTVGLKLERTEAQRTRRRLLLSSLVVNLGILGVFKYFNFFAGGLQAVAGALGLRLDFVHLNIILPVGISFYTFKTLSYTIDVYRRKLPPTRSLVDYALYVSFFPNLVAGPIDRARSLLPQIAGLRAPTRQQVREGLVLITLGLFKKVLIGDAAGRVVDNVFGQPELYRSPELLAGLILFSLQIYADFSGYSNIARGVAKLFGVELMTNFEQPYLSRSFSEFWRRWHISLSTWIWDYLFNPLMSACLRRAGKWRLRSERAEMRVAYACAALPTMLLCGLWHGAGLTYLAWGGLHGVFLTVERLFIYRQKAIPKWGRIRNPRGLARFLTGLISTQILVAFAWLVFRAADLRQVGYFLDRIVHWQGSDLTGRFALMVVGFGLAVLILDVIEYTSRSEVFLLKFRPAVVAGICAAVVITVALFMATTAPRPFVYFQF